MPDGTQETSIRIMKMVVTPGQAQTWLDMAPRNRTLRPAKLLEYSTAMANHAWKESHQGLAFDAHGHLLDGAHRLHACIKAGVPFTTLVSFGIDPAVRQFMDIGVTRTPGDILGIDREQTQTNLLAATLRWLWVYDQGKMTTDFRRSLPKSELFVLRDRYINLPGSFWVASMQTLLPQSLGVALHYLMAKKDAHLAEEFMKELGLGEGLHREEPMYKLRTVLLENVRNTKRKMTPAYQAAIVIKTWNRWRVGNKTHGRTPRWISSGEKAEQFPTIL